MLLEDSPDVLRAGARAARQPQPGALHLLSPLRKALGGDVSGKWSTPEKCCAHHVVTPVILGKKICQAAGTFPQ